MTNDEVRASLERADKATPGEWLSYDTEDGEWVVSIPVDGEATVTRLHFGDMEDNTGQDIRNADFIAHARLDLPAIAHDLVEAWKKLRDVSRHGRLALRAFDSNWAIDWNELEDSLDAADALLKTAGIAEVDYEQ